MLEFIKEWWPILTCTPYIYIKTKAYFFNGGAKDQKDSNNKVEFTGNIAPREVQ